MTRKRTRNADVVIWPEFRDMIPPLTDAERESLEFSIIAAGGAREPLDVWRPNGVRGPAVLLDGHNRFAICAARGLPYTTRELEFSDADAAKAWMFENQIARRNLSPDQVIALAAARGVASTRGTRRQREMAATLAEVKRLSPVIAGRLSLALAYGAYARSAGLITKKPRNAKGPAKSSIGGEIPEGQELAGQSTYTKEGQAPSGWTKTRVAGAEEPPHDPTPPGHLIKKTSTYFRGDGSTIGQWVSAERKEVERWQRMCDAVKELLKDVRPLPALPPPVAAPSNRIVTVYGFGDPHFGMLSWGEETGEDFDTKIAREVTTKAARAMVSNAPAAERALLVIVGDNFHADDDKQVTPGHGHKLDVDSRAGKVFRIGCETWRTVIDHMLTKHARVTVDVVRGNHDPLTAFFLRELLWSWYRDENRVDVADNIREHRYHLFGKVLIGTTHGHKTKPEGLAGVMAADVPDLWNAASAERHWITGHIHSKTWHDFRGCSLETLRTLAPGDAYAAGMGYRSRQAAVVIEYDTEYGEVGRQTMTPARARALAAAESKAA